MEREVQHKVNGEMQTDIQYYHRIVVVVLFSTDFPIPLGVRFQKNGEAEVSCALALLQDLVGQLGRRFLDVLVRDALYRQAPCVREVERLGLVWAFTLKENQPELLREAERLPQERSLDTTKATRGSGINWYWAKQRGTSRLSAWPAHERCRIFGGHGCGLGGGRRPRAGLSPENGHR